LTTRRVQFNGQRPAELVAISVLLVCGTMSPIVSRAQPQIQTKSGSVPEFKYDVVSVKPNKIGNNSTMRITPDGLIEVNAGLRGLIRQAFGIEVFQLSGEPTWFKSERYDVEAKMDESVADGLQKLPPDESKLARQQMLQALLADRFGLVIHHEQRDFPVYKLVIAKNGPKLQEAKPGDTYANGIKYPNGPGRAGATQMHMTVKGQLETEEFKGQAMSLGALCQSLGRILNRPVLDMTGLVGRYDVTFEFEVDVQNPAQPDALPDPGALTLFAAVQQQLGLKLESGKGPFDVIVIDHIERPTAN
jgi:uncharacterized protein (TIGR03435 family)